MKLLLANILNVVWILGIASTLIVHIGSLFTPSFNGGPLSILLIPVLLGWVIGLLLRFGGVYGDIARMIANVRKNKMLFGPPEAKTSRNLPAWVTKANILLGFYGTAGLIFFCGSMTFKLIDPNRLILWFLSGISFAMYWQVWTKTYEWLRNLQARADTLEPMY